MSAHDPQQELFARLYMDLKALGYDVYDAGLPPEGTPYPFIYLADNQQDDQETKTAVLGEVEQTIRVYHNEPGQRGTVSKMMLDIKNVCRKIKKTDNFSWFVNHINQRILPETVGKSTLLHGHMTVTFKFS